MIVSALAAVIGKKALGAIKHVAGATHIENAIGGVPTSVPQVVEALGGRGVLGIFLGLYIGNDEFRGHVDAAIKVILPFVD